MDKQTPKENSPKESSARKPEDRANSLVEKTSDRVKGLDIQQAEQLLEQSCAAKLQADLLKLKSAGKIVEFAKSRYGVKEGQEADYHRAILLTEDQVQKQREDWSNGKKTLLEQPSVHWMRVHLAERKEISGPRPLVLLCSGNADALTNEVVGYDNLPSRTRGTPYLFEQLAARYPNGYDLVQFRLGDQAAFLKPGLNNDIARQHMKNVVQDAVKGRGIFRGREYSSIATAYFSYGSELGVVTDEVLAEEKSPIPHRARVSIDGIKFKTTGEPVRERPAGFAGEYLHIYQTQRAPADPQSSSEKERQKGFIKIIGAPLSKRSPLDNEYQFKTGSDRMPMETHGAAHNVERWGTDMLYEKVLGFLKSKVPPARGQSPKLAQADSKQ